MYQLMGKEKVQSQPIPGTLPQKTLSPPTNPEKQPQDEIFLKDRDKEEIQFFAEAQIFINSILMVP